MTSAGSPLSFPCIYPLKVMGHRTDDFRSVALGIVHKHVRPEDVLSIEERPSKGGKYLGLTYTLNANSKQQMDALHVELTSCQHVLVVL